MRSLFITLCLANIAFAFGMIPWMPNPMAVHFALDGTPDGWGPPLVNALLMSIVVGIMTAIILGISLLAPVIPKELWNIPNRDYWLNEENRPQTIRRCQLMIELIGTGSMLIILLVQWELFQANRTVPPTKLNAVVLLCATGILVAVIIFESVRFSLSFRLPKEKRQLDGSAIPTTMTPNEKPKGDNQ